MLKKKRNRILTEWRCIASYTGTLTLTLAELQATSHPRRDVATQYLAARVRGRTWPGCADDGLKVIRDQVELLDAHHRRVRSIHVLERARRHARQKQRAVARRGVRLLASCGVARAGSAETSAMTRRCASVSVD